MPNGHDKNWFRLCGAINGFRVRYGRWPTRVRLFPVSLEDLRSIFSQEDLARIVSLVKLVADEAPFVAEDETGANYNYGVEGFPKVRPTPSAQEWLGVHPKPEE